MKKILVAILVLVLCVTALVACNNTDNNEGLERAKEYLDALYKAEPKITAADIERVPSLRVGEDTFTVTWTVEIIDGPQTVTVVPGEGKVIIDVEEATEDVVEDTNYKLIATIADKDGNTVQVSYLHTIPKFKVNTGAEYLAAEAGEAILVDGIVTAILPTGNGATAEGFFMNALDGSCGIYVYGAYTKANDSAEIAVGMTVRVAGEKDVYSGTHELKSASYRVLDTTIQTVEPVDYTSILANAADLKAEELTTAQALLVTIKGVTVGEPGDNGYHYFTLGDKETYVRISSSQCPLTTAQQNEFKQSFADHFGYTADVTGLITLYSGNFYLTPVTADAFSNFVAPQLTDQQIVDGAKDALSIVDVIKEAGSVTLPEAGTGIYADATITWALAETTLATLQGNVLNVAELPAEEGTITLTATIAKGDATAATKEFTVTIKSSIIDWKDATFAVTEAGKLDGPSKETSTEEYYFYGIVGTEPTADYCNFNLTDGTNSILVYGLYAMDGENRYGTNREIAEIPFNQGDLICLRGNLQNYNGTLEIKNAVLVETPAQGTAIANPYTAKEAVEEAGKLDGPSKETSTEEYYFYGTVGTEPTADYCNFNLTDGTNSILVYGLYAADGENRYGTSREIAEIPFKQGDVMYIRGYLQNYNGTLEIKNAVLISFSTPAGGETPCEHVDEDPADCICDLCQAELEHVNEEGDDTLCDVCNKDLSTGSTDTPGTITTIAGALAAAEGATVELTGTVSGIYQAWSEQHSNISYYITDGTDTILAYRAGSIEVKVGDVVKVAGTITKYNSVNQIAQGGVTTLITAHVCGDDMTEADCLNAAKCNICGSSVGEALGHTEANAEGNCDRCGTNLEVAASEITASITLNELKAANTGWTIGGSSATKVTSFNVDDNVTVTIGGGANSGKVYSESIRIYATDSPAGTITVSVPEGYELVSVKVTTAAQNVSAFLYVEGTTVDISNVTTAVSGQSVVLTSAKNGTDGKQVRLTAIEVVYRPVSA